MEVTTRNQQQMTTGQLELSSFFLKILKNRDIDWNDDAIFENGKVVGFNTNKASNHYHMRPRPTGENTVNEAKEISQKLDVLMRPATQDQVSMCLKKLSIHCGKQNRSPAEIALLVADYYFDIGGYPINLIQEACDTYRKLPEGNEFMPKSGRLIELMSIKWHNMKMLRTKVDKILGTHEEKKPRENKMVSLDDALAELI